MHLISKDDLLQSNFSEIIESVKNQIISNRTLEKPQRLTGEVSHFSDEIHFTDRENITNYLSEILEIEIHKQVKILLYGAGGYGKSLIAKKYMYENEKKYDSISRVEIKGNTLLDVTNKFKGFEPISDNIEENIKQFIKYLNSFKGINLLILDDLSLITSDWERLFGLLGTEDSKWRILVTSRGENRQYFSNCINPEEECDKSIITSARIEVLSLKPKDAEELFCKIYKGKEKDGIKELLEFVEYNTLFIKIVACMADDCGLTFLREKINRISLIKGSVVIDGNKLDSETLINNLYEISSLSKDEINALIFAVFFMKDEINLSLVDFFIKNYEKSFKSELLKNLARKGWLDSSSGGLYSIHPLIRKLMLEKLKSNNISYNKKFLVNAIRTLCLFLKCSSLSQQEKYCFIRIAQSLNEVDAFNDNEEFQNMNIALARLYTDLSINNYSDQIIDLLENTKEYLNNANLKDVEAEVLDAYAYYHFVSNKKEDAYKALDYIKQASDVRKNKEDKFQSIIENYNKGLVKKAHRPKNNSEIAIKNINSAVDYFLGVIKRLNENSFDEKEVEVIGSHKISLIEGKYYSMSIKEYLISANDNLGDILRLKVNDYENELQSEDEKVRVLDLAKKHLEEALKGARSFYPNNNKSLLRCITSTAHIYKTDFDKTKNTESQEISEKYHKEAISMCEKMEEESTVSSSEIPLLSAREIGRSYQSAAEFYYCIGDSKKALELINKTVEIREKIFPPKNNKLKGSLLFQQKIQRMNKLKDIILEINKEIDLNKINKVLPEGVNENKAKAELNDIKKNILKSLKPVDNKKIIHMGGLPGSGKSTYCKNHIISKYPDFLYLGFDSIMESISFYQQDKDKDPVKAFKRWEIPARVLGYEILSEAFEMGLSIIFDNGGANPKHVEILKKFKEFHYETEMFYLGGTPKELSSRIKKREEQTGRHFPLEEMDSRFDSLEKNVLEYKKLVDNFHIVSSLECN